MPSSYFPPLDKCLAGEERLLPFSAAYRALCDPTTAADSAALEAFFSDIDVTNYLSASFDPFLPPSQKTKSDFETKTAPIHVSQSASGDYDLEEMKEDALWLSEQVRIEELVALRIVILEWQQRAEYELIERSGGLVGAVVPVAGDFGAATLGKSSFSFTASTTGAGMNKRLLDLGKEEGRRLRQLRIYLEEKSWILKLSTELVNRFAAQGDETKTGRNWIEKLAAKVVNDQCSINDEEEHQAFCAQCIDFLSDKIQQVSDPSKVPEVFKSDQVKNAMYEEASFQDMTTAMRLLMTNTYLFDGVPGHKLITDWFKLMADVNFFQDLAPSLALPDPTGLQSLGSIISLSILQLPQVLERIQKTAVPMLEGVSYPQLEEDKAFISNDACVKALNLVLFRAAQINVPLASPAILAWSVITSLIGDIAGMQQEIREQLRSGEDGSSDSETTTRRRPSGKDSREDMSAFERQFASLQDFEMDGEARDDPPRFFALAAVDGMSVFSIISRLSTTISAIYRSEFEATTAFFGRTALLDLVRESLPRVEYGGEVLESILNVLSPDMPGKATKFDVHLVDRFLGDVNIFRPRILEQALARYPFELLPMLRLFTCLVSAASNSHPAGPPDIVKELESLRTLTVMVPEHFRAYQLDHEDENMNSMLLTNALPLFVSKLALSSYDTDFLNRRDLTMGDGEDEQSMVVSIPSGAEGIVVKESRPLVFRLEHPHSGLEYLGLLLSTFLPNSELVVAPIDFALNCSQAAEIVTLINALLASSLRQHQGAEEAKFVLGRLGSALRESEQDIISVVADILETELLAHLDQSSTEGSLDLLVACAEFFDTLTKISPQRVWSTLAMNSLLGISGGTSALPAVVGGTEVQLGRYRFLAACVRIYSHLIDDAVSGLVKRKGRPSKNANRFDSPILSQDYTPERAVSTVLNAYRTVMVDAWQSLGEWRFAVPSEKSEIASLILNAFDRLLRSTYGIGVSKENGKRLWGLLLSSATAILDTFVPEHGNGESLRSFGAIFSSAFAVGEQQIRSQDRISLLQLVDAASGFLKTLIRTIRMVDQEGKRPYHLGVQSLKLVPVLAALLAADHTTKGSIALLLTEITQAVATSGDADPPSLLGQLSPDVAKAFLAVVSQLDRPLTDIEVESKIWDFLSTVMSSRQRWFAAYLLTGTIPKDRLKDTTTTSNASNSKGNSILTSALDQLSTIATLPPDRAIAMLKFVTAAQNTWIWANNEVRSHVDFLKNALQWLNDLQDSNQRAPNMAEELILANEHRMAAHLCDILAVNLHASMEVGDKTVLKMVGSKLGFLRQHGVSVGAYNRSLHRNLAENFRKRFPACEVDYFKRTVANPAPLGRDYFYDLDLADTVLGHEVAWSGAMNGRSQGFADEFARANMNLSLVKAQTRLLKSWRVLATTLSDCADQDAALQSELAKTAEVCLRANVEANLDQPGMDEVVKVRAEMAFMLVSKLVSVKAGDAAMKALLPAAWELVRASPVDYDVATAEEDLRYYRTLLKVLYLTLQPHAYMEPERSREPKATDETQMEYLDPTIAAMIVEIVAKVIAPGFRALCGNLHTNAALAQPGDFALLTALLQALLSIHGVAAVHAQIADVVGSSSLIRGALSLYSWADQLAEVMDQDPVYGEMAIMFLVGLSTVRPVAEQIAVEGALIQLSSANLSNYFRKPGGKGPFDEPSRMFTIWTEGFLPLCLNLLDAVGPAIAAEISTFLNSFPAQLTRAESSLENRARTRQNPHAGAVTLSLVSEAHSLCLISLILSSDIARGAADGINAADVPRLEYDYLKVKDVAAGLMRQKMSLAARIVPVGSREVEWSGRSVAGAYDNALQAKVVREVVELVGLFGGGL